MEDFRIYNHTLCPDLWDVNQHLDPTIRTRLLQLANDFYEKTEFVAPIIDIYLMGSIAAYNWTPESDIDIHIIIDFNQLQMPTETASKIVKTVGASWNIEHNVTIKTHKVEINIQNVKEEKPHVSGIYSLTKDAWIRKPILQRFYIDPAIVKPKYDGMLNYINSVIESGNREKMKSAKKYVDAFRQYGLDTCGELSMENVVFKMLRAKGIIKKLKDAIVATYDRQMTIKEVSNDGQKHFTISPPEHNGVIPINLDGKRIAQMYKPAKGWGQHSGRWVFNRGGIAIDMGFPTIQKSYNTPEELLSDLETWYANRGVSEVTQKDIRSRLPQFAFSGLPNLSKMTLDNLKALAMKAGREWRYYRTQGDRAGYERALKKFSNYHNEIKRRLQYINHPVTEGNDLDYIAAKDFQERRDRELYDLAMLLKKSRGRGRVPWKTVPATLLKKVWYQFGKYQKINENDLDKIADQILTNIARLDASTGMMGHTPVDVRSELDDLGVIFTDKQWDDWMSKYFTSNDGGWLLSDYGLEPLKRIYDLIFNALTPEEKLYACDKALNVVHQRGDLAAMFVEGGVETLNDIMEQGGYQDPTNQKYGDINRQFLEPNKMEEGYGAGIPEDDRLKIKNTDNSVRRWQIRSKDAPKTPKMTDEIVVPVPLNEGIDTRAGDDLTPEESDQLNQFVADSGIHIGNNKEVYYVITVDDVIAGALYTSYVDGTYSFDIVVAKEYQRQGLAKKMTKDALSEYFQQILDMDPNAKLELDVVNPNMIDFLKRQGLDVVQTIGGHTLMSLKN